VRALKAVAVASATTPIATPARTATMPGVKRDADA